MLSFEEIQQINRQRAEEERRRDAEALRKYEEECLKSWAGK